MQRTASQKRLSLDVARAIKVRARWKNREGESGRPLQSGRRVEAIGPSGQQVPQLQRAFNRGNHRHPIGRPAQETVSPCLEGLNPHLLILRIGTQDYRDLRAHGTDVCR